MSINILILGETGVGKSTWINAFYNFITFETLNDANLHNEVFSLIPSKFIAMDEDYQPVEVHTRPRITVQEEILAAGQSATQRTQIYEFQAGNNVTIRLIDTPGVGDCRGIEKDKENFQNILQTIQQIEELHGICILLKPNNARLNVTFRFCLNELLTHLHRDAVRNIVFCFTNTRGTFYRPGDTIPALKALLDENKEVSVELSKKTIYCFDSEAFRFLAAIKNYPPVQFTEKEKANFSESWDTSTAETRRLLKYIRTLQPHPVRSTINLNHIRGVVIKLSRPLAEMTRNVHTNKDLVKAEMKEIQETDEDIKQLEQKKYEIRKEIETTKLEYPRTVCTNSDCVRILDSKDQVKNKSNKVYKVCCERCKVWFVTEDAVGAAMLRWCRKFTLPGDCKNCKHSFREHMKIFYESKEVELTVENPVVREALNAQMDAKLLKEVLIKEKEKSLAEYEFELSEIQNASVKFACFLKKNAITPYNDGIESYLNYLISIEEQKANCDRSLLKSLNEHKRRYLEEKNTFEVALKNGNNISQISLQDIEETVNKLKTLKHSGKNLSEALQYTIETSQNSFNSQVTNVSRNRDKNNKNYRSNVKSAFSFFYNLTHKYS